MSAREIRLADEAKGLQDHLMVGSFDERLVKQVLTAGFALHPESREPCFIVYMKSLQDAESFVPSEWEGLQVLVRKAGHIEPL